MNACACSIKCMRVHARLHNLFPPLSFTRMLSPLRARAFAPHGTHSLQEMGCSALGNLAWSNSAIQARIAELGGIEEIVRATQSHVRSGGCMQKCTLALGNLACHAQNQVCLRLAVLCMCAPRRSYCQSIGAPSAYVSTHVLHM